MKAMRACTAVSMHGARSSPRRRAASIPLRSSQKRRLLAADTLVARMESGVQHEALHHPWCLPLSARVPAKSTVALHGLRMREWCHSLCAAVQCFHWRIIF